MCSLILFPRFAFCVTLMRVTRRRICSNRNAEECLVRQHHKRRRSCIGEMVETSGHQGGQINRNELRRMFTLTEGCLIIMPIFK